MTTVTIEEAQKTLGELIEHLAAGEQVIITRNSRPIARLEREVQAEPPRRRPGSAKGRLTIVTEDEEHLRDFEAYSE